MNNFLIFAGEWWWVGLIFGLLFLVPPIYIHWKRKNIVEAQFIVVGTFLTFLMVVYYSLSILSFLFSFLGFGHRH